MVDIGIKNKSFKRSAGCVSTILDGETVILDVVSGIYSGLNEVGTVVWELLENQVTIAELREAILGSFDVSSEECSEHLLFFLQELADNKLIEVTGETSR
jgi:hypothetical protein